MTVRPANAALTKGLRLLVLKGVHVGNKASDYQNKPVRVIGSNLFWLKDYREVRPDARRARSKYVPRDESVGYAADTHTDSFNRERNTRRIANVHRDCETWRIFLVGTAAFSAPAIHLNPLLLYDFLQPDAFLRGFGGYSSGFRLRLNGPQGTKCGDYSPDTNQRQNPIRPSWRSKALSPISRRSNDQNGKNDHEPCLHSSNWDTAILGVVAEMCVDGWKLYRIT